MSKKVFISLGHGYRNDPGTIYKGLKEADLVEKIGDKVISKLQRHNVKTVRIPRHALDYRIAWEKKRAKWNDYTLSIHVNAGGGTGIEVWGYAGLPKKHNYHRYCRNILKGVLNETGLANRGVKDETDNRWGRLGIVHDTKAKACLVECGFIDNKKDRDILEKHSRKFAVGIAKGMLKELGKKYQPKNKKVNYKKKYKKTKSRLDRLKNSLSKANNKIRELWKTLTNR